MSDKEKYTFESVDRQEATYKRVGGLNVGISRGVRIEDVEKEIIIISLGERSQLGNKVKALEYFEAIEQLQAKTQECEELKGQLNNRENVVSHNYDLQVENTAFKRQLDTAIEALEEIVCLNNFKSIDAHDREIYMYNIAKTALDNIKNKDKYDN